MTNNDNVSRFKQAEGYDLVEAIGPSPTANCARAQVEAIWTEVRLKADKLAAIRTYLDTVRSGIRDEQANCQAGDSPDLLRNLEGQESALRWVLKELEKE